MAPAVTEGCRATPQRRGSWRPRPGPSATPVTAIPPRLQPRTQVARSYSNDLGNKYCLTESLINESVWRGRWGRLHAGHAAGLTQPKPQPLGDCGAGRRSA